MRKINITLKSLKNYLSNKHGKFRIKKIQQQYLNSNTNQVAVLKTAFQNLLSSETNYEIVTTTKDGGGYSEYEITFNSEGKHLSTRKAIAPKYDHVLFN